MISARECGRMFKHDCGETAERTRDTMKDPVTLKEYEEIAERVAMARFVCRTGKMPRPNEIADERRAMFNDAVQGKRVLPKMTRTEAAAWLGSNQLDLPAFEPIEKGDPMLVTCGHGVSAGATTPQ